MIYAVLVVVGVITGITAGMFGFGGGFVIVPLVYHLFPAYDILSGANERWLLQIGVATSTAVMIVGTVYSSFKHHRAGNIDWSSVFPLAAYIGIGSAAGAYVATIIPGSVLHTVFILYILAVIADCMLRKGFVGDSDGHEFHAMGRGMEVLAGLVIGAVASLLGVGGSVMTVPLMRRHGARMKNAVAMANPLSFPSPSSARRPTSWRPATRASISAPASWVSSICRPSPSCRCARSPASSSRSAPCPRSPTGHMPSPMSGS